MGGRRETQSPSLYTPRTSLVISRSYALLHDYGYTEQDVADVVASCKHCEEDINETITRMVVEGSEGRAWKTVQREPKAAATNKVRQRAVRDEQQPKQFHPRTGPSSRPHDRPARNGNNINGKRDASAAKDGGRKRVDHLPNHDAPEKRVTKSADQPAEVPSDKVAEPPKSSTQDKPTASPAVAKRSMRNDRTTWAQKLAGESAKTVPPMTPTPALSKDVNEAAAPAVAQKSTGKNSWASRARGVKEVGAATQQAKEEEKPKPAPVVEIEKTVVVEATIIPSTPATLPPIIGSTVLPPPLEAPPRVDPKPTIVKTVISKPVIPPAEVVGGIEHMSSVKPIIRTKILTRRDEIPSVTIPSYVPDRASVELAAAGDDLPERTPLHPEPMARHQVPVQRPVEQYIPQQVPQVPYYYNYDRMRYGAPPQQEYYAPPPTQSHYQRVPQMMGSRLEEDVPPPHMDQARYYQPAYHHYTNNCSPYDGRQTAEYEQAYALPPHGYRPGEMQYAQYGAPGQYAREDPQNGNRRENQYAAQYGMPPIFMTAAPQMDERSAGRYATYNAGYQQQQQAPPQYNSSSSGTLFKY